MKLKTNCPACGTKILPDAYYCNYCGAFFEDKQNRIEKEQLERFNERNGDHAVDMYSQQEKAFKEDKYNIDESENYKINISDRKLNSMLIKYNNLYQNNPMIIAIIIIILGNIVASIIVPKIMIFSWVAFAFIASGAQNEKTQQLNKLYKKGNYKEAYTQLDNIYKKHKKQSIIKQKILIAYYKLENFNEVKELIYLLNNKIHIRDANIEKIANNMRIEYTPLV